MNIRLSQSEFCLSKRQTLSLSDGAGVRIEAHAGTVWVTQDHDLRDVVLRAGEAVTLAGNRRVIVQAFEASRVSVAQPAAARARHGGVAWPARLAGAFKRLLPQTVPA